MPFNKKDSKSQETPRDPLPIDCEKWEISNSDWVSDSEDPQVRKASKFQVDRVDTDRPLVSQRQSLDTGIGSDSKANIPISPAS